MGESYSDVILRLAKGDAEEGAVIRFLLTEADQFVFNGVQTAVPLRAELLPALVRLFLATRTHYRFV